MAALPVYLKIANFQDFHFIPDGMRIAMDDKTIWIEVQNNLRAQMTRASFERSIAGTVLLGRQNGHYRVGVTDEAALDWLEHRLAGVVTRALVTVLAQPAQIKFELLTPAAPLPAVEAPVTQAQQVPAELVEFDFTRDQWVKHPRYLSLFYQPYLASFGRFTNRAFGVWQFIRDSFDLKNSGAAWSPVYRSTLHDLAKATGCTPHQLAGVWAFCPTFDRVLSETGEAPAGCCGRYGQVGRRDWPAPANDDYPEGRPVCRYWKAGIFQLLAEHGLAVVEQCGTSSRTTIYKIQIGRWPRLLTPMQVARLEPGVGEAHREFLRNDLRVEVERWQQVGAASLAGVDRAGLEIDPNKRETLSLYRLNRVFFWPPIEFKQTQSGPNEAE